MWNNFKVTYFKKKPHVVKYFNPTTNLSNLSQCFHCDGELVTFSNFSDGVSLQVDFPSGFINRAQLAQLIKRVFPKYVHDCHLHPSNGLAGQQLFNLFM